MKIRKHRPLRYPIIHMKKLLKKNLDDIHRSYINSIAWLVKGTILKNACPITVPPLNRAALVIHTGSVDN